MNPLHYPSLELCKKLTEIGFPKTYMKMHWNEKYWFEPCTQWSFLSSLTGSVWKTYDYRCPSVMEMLDVMPKSIEIANTKYLQLEFIWDCSVRYKWDRYATVASRDESISNALAEMILWLNENKYLTFNNEKS